MTSGLWVDNCFNTFSVPYTLCYIILLYYRDTRWIAYIVFLIVPTTVLTIITVIAHAQLAVNLDYIYNDVTVRTCTYIHITGTSYLI